MIKRLVTFLIAAAGLLSLSSCDLEMNGTYVYNQFVSVYNFENEEDYAPVYDYFKTTLDFEQTYSFDGSYSDACSYGLELLRKNISTLNNETILGLLEGQEAVQYYMTIKGNNVNEVLGVVTWTARDLDEGGDAETVE